MTAPSVFGELPGFTEGFIFESREHVRVAGLHRHKQAGISGDFEEGADAIVLSGGYIDDKDEGDYIVYTGQGGQGGNKHQIRDQELTKGNLGLVRSEERGLPVRVIRGWGHASPYSPALGYRYDGLYLVTRHWSEPSADGPLVWRFVLEKSDGGGDWEALTGPKASVSGTPMPSGAAKPARSKSVVQRVVRNSAVTQWVKKLHDYVCQVCGTRLEVDGGPYAEGAHIRALGSPHNGQDVPANVLCLCPNDHVLFDKGAIYVEAGLVYLTVTRKPVSTLRTSSQHTLDTAAVAYHRSHFAGVH